MDKDKLVTFDGFSVYDEVTEHRGAIDERERILKIIRKWFKDSSIQELIDEINSPPQPEVEEDAEDIPSASGDAKTIIIPVGPLPAYLLEEEGDDLDEVLKE